MESPEKENGDILNDSIDQLEAIVDTNQSPYVFYSTASNTNSNNLKDNSSKLQIYRQQACETPSQTPRFNKFNSSEIHPQNSHPTSLHRLPSNYDSIESFCCRDQQKQISSQAESGRGSSSRIGGLTSPSAVLAQSPVPVFGVAVNGYQGQDNKQNNYSVLSQNIDIQQKDVIITSMVNGENEYTKNHKKQQQQQNNEIFKNINTNENIHGDQLLHYDGNNILTEKNFTFYNGSQKSVKKQRILIKKDIKNKGDDNRDYDSKDQHNGDKGNNNNTNIEGVVIDASGVTKNSSGTKIVSNIDEKDNKHQVNYYSKGKCRSISSYYYCYSDKNTSEQQQQQLQQCMIGQDLIDDTKNKKNKGKKQSQKDIGGTDQLAQLNNSNLIQERKQLSSQIVDDQQFRRKKIFSYHSGVNQIAKTEPDEGNNNNILMNGNVLECLSQNQTFQNSTYQNYIAQLRQNFASSEKDQVNDEQQLLGLLPKQDQQIKQNNFLSSAKVISYQLNRIRQQVSLQQQVSAAKAMREESNGQQVGSITAGSGTTPLKDKNSNIEHNNKIKSNSNTNNNNISNGSYSQMNPSVKFLRKAFSQQGQATLNHNHNSFITKITPTKDGLGQIAMIKGDNNNNNNNTNTNNSIPWRRSRSAERGNSSSKIRSDSESGEHYNPKRKRIMLGAQNYQMFESRGLMILPQSTQSEQSWQLFNDKLDQTEGKLQSGSNHISGTTNSNVKKPQSSSYPTRNHKQHGNVLLNSQIDSKINENNNQIDDLFFNGNSSNNNVIGGDGIKQQQQQQQQQQSLIENVRIQSAKIDVNNQVVQKNKGDQYLLGNSQVSKVQQQQPQQIQQLAQIEINSKNSNTSQNNNINTLLDYSSNYQQGSSKKQEKKMQLAAWHVRKINKSNSNSNNNTTNISQHKRHLFGQSSGQNNQSGFIDEFITEDVENQLIQSSPNQEKIIKINNKIKGQKDQNNNSNQFIRCSSLNQDNNSNINNINSNNLRASLDIKRNINNSNFLNLDGFSLRANSQIPKGINEQQQLQQQQIMKQPKSMQFDLSPISPLAITFLQTKGGENNSNNNKNHIFFPNLPARRADSAGRVTKPAYIINNNNINISNNSSNYNSNHIARTFSRQTNTTNNNNNNNNNSPTFVQLAQQVFRKI